MSMPHRDVVRARTILLLTDGVSQSEVSRRVGLQRRIVRKWAQRFVERGLLGLNDAPRSGRPPRFSPGGENAPRQARV
jgi:transposase